MSKKTQWLNDAAELRGFLANRNIDAKQFATRAGMTVEQLERVLSGKKAIDLATIEKIEKAKTAYPLTKQTMDIASFIKRLELSWKTCFNAHITRSEMCNMFIVKMDGLDSNSDIMRICVEYSGRFENKFHMALLFIDSLKKIPHFIWEKISV